MWSYSEWNSATTIQWPRVRFSVAFLLGLMTIMSLAIHLTILIAGRFEQQRAIAFIQSCGQLTRDEKQFFSTLVLNEYYTDYELLSDLSLVDARTYRGERTEGISVSLLRHLCVPQRGNGNLHSIAIIEGSIVAPTSILIAVDKNERVLDWTTVRGFPVDEAIVESDDKLYLVVWTDVPFVELRATKFRINCDTFTRCNPDSYTDASEFYGECVPSLW